MNNKADSTNNKEIKKMLIIGEVPSTSELGWKKIGKEILEKSIDAIKTTSEKIIGLDTALITAYIAALTFLKIPANIDFYLPWYLSKIIVAGPIILWLVSLSGCILAYSAKGMKFYTDCPEDIKKAYEENRDKSSTYLTIGKSFFIVGLFFASTIILIGSGLQPLPVQFTNENSLLLGYLVKFFIVVFIFSTICWLIYLSKKEKQIAENKLLGWLIHTSITESEEDKWLKIKNYCIYSFVISIILMICIIIIGVNSYHPLPVQFIVAKDNVPLFENMSINIDNQTMNTIPMILIAESDKYYKVQLDNGKVIQFNKDMVKGMMYYINNS